ncbi:MAG: hypothetical protein EHM48_04370 [Planctomycetaceae bacterium]|nr:MAG: hypothetical protein EHM48_04370 [Planctomycetaceae bacterium]
MNREEILARAKSLTVAITQPFVMATVSPDGKPDVRWMGAKVLEEPFTVYMVTFRQSQKVKDIQANANTRLLLFKADFSEQVALVGTAELDDSAEKKNEVWQKIPASSDYFKGPADPTFAVIKMAVKHVELWTSHDQREPVKADV